MEHTPQIHPESLHPESLLEHGPRLRTLARRLVRDEQHAADLVQETWVRALERGPGGAAPWRWLARVLRNLAFQERRMDATRAERERVVARADASEGESERFAMHRELVSAIEQLEAPYRQAIVLRYFDALPPRKIAARLGVSVKTVKTRLNRGIALLRGELDRKHGSRASWLAAMLPLARTARMARITPWLPASAGGMVKLAAAAAVAGIALYTLVPSRSTRVAPLVVSAAPAGMATAPATELAPSSPVIAEREAVRETALPAAPNGAVLPPGPALAMSSVRHGIVLGPDGLGLAGVQIGFDPRMDGAPAPVQSGADGGFDLPDLGGVVQSRDERFATVLSSTLDPARAKPGQERVVVVAPAVNLGGIVRDEHGAPAAGVLVRMEIPLSFRGRFRAVLDDSITEGASATTDEQGRFLMSGAAGLTCAQLVAWWGHTSSVGVPVPGHDELGLELVLGMGDVSAPGPDALHVVGEVRHAGGALAPGALVSLAGVTTRADADALFELFVPPPTSGDPRRLVAVALNEQAAILEPARDANGVELWPPFTTLWLGGEARALGGRVIGTDGEPLANVPVWIDDLTFVGATHDGFLTLEHQMAGKSDRERWFSARTDADGRFALGGLCARSYTVAAMDPATLLVVRSQPVAAGREDVELVLAESGLFARVAGRVVDTHGQPLTGLRVRLERTTFEVFSFKGDRWYGRENGAQAQTDADGRFAFERVPREGMRIAIHGNTFAPVDLALEGIADPLHVDVVAPWLGHVQISLGGALPEHGSIELRDEGDHALEFYVFGGGSVWIRSGVDLGNANEFADGRTPVLSVPETVRSVVLRDADGNELRRVPLVLGESLASVQL